MAARLRRDPASIYWSLTRFVIRYRFCVSILASTPLRLLFYHDYDIESGCARIFLLDIQQLICYNA